MAKALLELPILGLFLLLPIGGAFSSIYIVVAIVKDKPHYYGARLLNTIRTAVSLDPTMKPKIVERLPCYLSSYLTPGVGGVCINKTTHDTQVKMILDEIDSQDANRNVTAIVVLACCGISASTFQYFAAALKVGISIFFIHKWPDMQEYNLDPTKVMMWAVAVNMDKGIEENGKEWCRRTKGKSQKVVLFNHNNDTSRQMGVVQSFQHFCPNNNVTKLWLNISAIDYDSMEAFFIANPDITAAVALEDIRIESLINAADRVLGPRARSMFFIGFNHNRPHLLEKKRLTSTLDPCFACMWKVCNQTMHLVKRGFNSTSIMLRKMHLPSLPLRTDMTLIAADAAGYVMSQQMPLYDKTVRAIPESGDGPTCLSVGIHNLSVGSFDVRGFSFECEFWLEQMWQDTRFSWSEVSFNKTLAVDSSQLWNPDVQFINIRSAKNIIFDSRVIVNHSGMFRKKTKITGSFDCDMTVAPYPFTVFTCSIDVGVSADSSDIELNPDLGLTFKRAAEEFYEPRAISNSVVDNKVSFKFQVVHKPNFVMLCFVLPAYMLNIISFSLFYLPGHDNRTGLGLTAVLAQMVLQIEARVGVVATWLDIMLNTSFLFQVLSFALSLSARRTATRFESEDTLNMVATASSPKRSSKLCETRTHVLDRMLKVAFGAERTSPEKRFARCFVVPLYLAIISMLCFAPTSGTWDINKHPDYGFNCLLFWLNSCILVSMVILAICKGTCKSSFRAAPAQPLSAAMETKKQSSFIAVPAQVGRRQMAV